MVCFSFSAFLLYSYFSPPFHMTLSLISFHQLILLLLFIPQYVSFYSSLPPSLVLYWSGPYWLSFECMTTFSAINNPTYNDLSCLCYDAYILQPLALWIGSHTLSILKGKLRKGKFSFCFVWQYRSCVSHCYCSISKASHAAMGSKCNMCFESLIALSVT